MFRVPSSSPFACHIQALGLGHDSVARRMANANMNIAVNKDRDKDVGVNDRYENPQPRVNTPQHRDFNKNAIDGINTG